MNPRARRIKRHRRTNRIDPAHARLMRMLAEYHAICAQAGAPYQFVVETDDDGNVDDPHVDRWDAESQRLAAAADELAKCLDMARARRIFTHPQHGPKAREIYIKARSTRYGWEGVAVWGFAWDRDRHGKPVGADQCRELLAEGGIAI